MLKRPHHDGEDMGSNPTATRNENWTLGGSMHRRCPNSPAGSEWKTSDIKAELDLYPKNNENEIKQF